VRENQSLASVDLVAAVLDPPLVAGGLADRGAGLAADRVGRSADLAAVLGALFDGGGSFGLGRASCRFGGVFFAGSCVCSSASMPVRLALKKKRLSWLRNIHNTMSTPRVMIRVMKTVSFMVAPQELQSGKTAVKATSWFTAYSTACDVLRQPGAGLHGFSSVQM
jgi:hypothetical protein